MDIESQSVQDRARVLAALGDPVRLGVLDLLVNQDLSPDAIGRSLGVPGNLLSHHLRVLEDCGLVRRTDSNHDRRRVYVQGRPEALHGLLPGAVLFPARRVLFVCTQNSARSVLAEALWRQASTVPCASAGTRPAPRVHARVGRAAARRGIPIAEHRPRALDEVLRPDDLVVSVCDAVNEELGPLSNPRLHWSIPDPAATDTDAAFDDAAAALALRVEQLVDSVVPVGRSRKTVR